MIIDSHCHCGKGDGLTGPWDTAAPLDKYFARASRVGITHTVLFAAFHSDYAIANREVARIVSSSPDRFFGFAFVHSVHDRGRVHGLVRRAVEEYGFVGIKLHRYDAPISREICEAARAFSLPVLYDVMGGVSVCELLAEEYPDINFVIPHLGSFADDWKAQVALIDHLVRHPNIYTDTSGVRRFDILEQAVQRAGSAKISVWLRRTMAPSGSGIGEGPCIRSVEQRKNSCPSGQFSALGQKIRSPDSHHEPA